MQIRIVKNDTMCYYPSLKNLKQKTLESLSKIRRFQGFLCFLRSNLVNICPEFGKNGVIRELTLCTTFMRYVDISILLFNCRTSPILKHFFGILTPNESSIRERSGSSMLQNR